MAKRVAAVRSITAAVSGVILAATLASAIPSAQAQQSAADRARQAADEQEMLEKARRERAPVNIGEGSSREKIAQEKARQDELQRLSEKLARASANRPRKPVGPVDTPWSTEVVVAPSTMAPDQRYSLGAKTGSPSAYDGRVTVLMIMTPGNKGIRRFDKSADPILCARDGCYISSGAEIPARFISLSRSLGPANTFGARAGACNQKTGCVFRGVDVSGGDAVLQPVDLKVISHDRRNMMSAYTDMSCRVDGERLTCGRPMVAADYTLWVVPERVAEQAGAAMLQRALDDGLPGARFNAEVPTSDLPWQRRD